MSIGRECFSLLSKRLCSFLFTLCLFNSKISSHMFGTVISQSFVKTFNIINFNKTHSSWSSSITIFNYIAWCSWTESIKVVKNVLFRSIIGKSWDSYFQNNIRVLCGLGLNNRFLNYLFLNGFNFFFRRRFIRSFLFRNFFSWCSFCCWSSFFSWFNFFFRRWFIRRFLFWNLFSWGSFCYWCSFCC